MSLTDDRTVYTHWNEVPEVISSHSCETDGEHTNRFVVNVTVEHHVQIVVVCLDSFIVDTDLNRANYKIEYNLSV